ncbi:MAG: hypothetical protein WCX22_07675 [Methanoregula sp.]
MSGNGFKRSYDPVADPCDGFVSPFGHRPVTFPVVVPEDGTEHPISISMEYLNRCRNPGNLVVPARELCPTG